MGARRVRDADSDPPVTLTPLLSMRVADGKRPIRVAVIGSGIAGLGAARALSSDFAVDVYESQARAGGHAHTVDTQTGDPRDGDRPIAVDTGFIVYNERNYPRLTTLFSELGVPTQDACMSFSNTCVHCAFELGSNNLHSVFAQRGSLLQPSRWMLLAGLLQFFRRAKRDLANNTDLSSVTLGDYLREARVQSGAIRHFILPMGAAVWSCAASEMLHFPAETFLRFFNNHGMLGVKDAPQWRTVTGGSREYLQRLIAQSPFTLYTSTPVEQVLRNPDGCTLHFRNREPRDYDAVVFATPAHSALRMLAEPSHDEAGILGAIGSTPNRTVLHTDASFMPRARAAWASWNHRIDNCRAVGTTVEVTYWMNRLQSLSTHKPLLVTLNPGREIASGSVLREFNYSHPHYNLAALRAQKSLHTIQGIRGVWYCGAWTGYGFHEDGLRSGQLIAGQMRETLLQRSTVPA